MDGEPDSEDLTDSNTGPQAEWDSAPPSYLKTKWVSMIVRLSRRVGLFLWDEGVRPFSRRDGAGLSWRCRAAARLRE